MAETADVEEPSEAVEQATTVAAPQEEGPDAAKAVKERVKRLERPKVEETKLQVEKLQAQLDKNKARVEEIKELISSKHNNRSRVSTEQQAVRNRLAELKAQFQAELAKKQGIKQELEDATKARNQLREQMRALRTKIQYPSTDKIDEAIAKLEQRMNHSSMSLAEEKKVLEDIKKLKVSRATVQQYNERLEKMNEDDEVRNQIIERLRGCDERLNAVKAEEETKKAELGDIRQREMEQVSDVPVLIRERDECKEIMSAAYHAIKQIKSEHKAKMDEYFENERLWRAQRNEERKAKQEAYVAEQEAKRKQRAAEHAEFAGEPYHKEVTMCEQLINYLSKFRATETAAVTEQKREVVAPEGMVVLKKKDPDAEVLFVGGKGKGKKGKREGKADKAPEEQKLTHSLDILEAFRTLKVDVPHTSTKAVPAVEQIKGRLEYYLEKRRAAKENGIEAPEAEADDDAEDGAGPSSSGAAGRGGARRANGVAHGSQKPPVVFRTGQIKPVTVVLTPNDDGLVDVALDVDTTEDDAYPALL